VSKGVAAPVIDTLVHGARRTRLIHVRKGDSQTVNCGQRVEVARAENALAAFHQDGVRIARDQVFLEFHGNGSQASLDLDRGRMVGSQKLAACLQHLPADSPLCPDVFDSFEQDAEVL